MARILHLILIQDLAATLYARIRLPYMWGAQNVMFLPLSVVHMVQLQYSLSSTAIGL